MCLLLLVAVFVTLGVTGIAGGILAVVLDQPTGAKSPFVLMSSELLAAAALLACGLPLFGRAGLGLAGDIRAGLRAAAPLAVVLGGGALVSAAVTGKDVLSDELTTTLVVQFAIFALAVGVAEELVFRGAMVTILGERARPVLAVVTSSLLFGLVHLLPGLGGSFPVVAINALAVGIAVGVPGALIRLRTGSIVGLVTAHALIDFCALLHLGKVQLPASMPASEVAGTLVVSVIVMAAYVVWYRRGAATAPVAD